MLTEVFREGIAQYRLGDKAQHNQRLAQRVAGTALLQQGNVQLVLRDQAFGRKQLAQRRLDDGRVHRGTPSSSASRCVTAARSNRPCSSAIARR
ncbi:hypothetical protein D3C72_2343540 [compost metagenome]